MKKSVFTAMVMLMMSVCVNAQFPMMGSGWGSVYEPGTPAWCWQQQQQINAIDYQQMIMRQQILNFYRQQAQDVTNWIMTNPTTPYPGSIITRDGTILNSENINDYERTKVSCENCNGGFNYKRIYAGNGQYITRKSRCSYCHGTGVVSKHVKR